DFFATPTTYKGIGLAQTALTGSANIGKPLGLKVELARSTADANTRFNTQYGTGTKAISYVFAHLKGAGNAVTLTNVTNLKNQIRSSPWSKNAYIGQYGLTPLDPANDRSWRSVVTGPDASSNRNWGKAQFDSAGINMANTSLYAGQGDYRNKSTFDWANSNIRTGLFVRPIMRTTGVQNILNTNYNSSGLATGRTNVKQLPWVSRFNNAGNVSVDTDQNSSNGHKFIPGAPLPQAGRSPAQTANQMMGRSDFSVQILHYRIRDAYSVNLFAEGASAFDGVSSGVIGYSSNMAKQDVREDTWNSRTNPIFNAADNKPATMTLNPQIDGTADSGGTRSEQTGTIWSGQYSLSLANAGSYQGKGALDILASNLDSTNHLIKFGTVDVYDIFCVRDANGYTYQDPNAALTPARNLLIEAGMHRLLQFDLVSTRVYNSSTFTGSVKTQTIWLLNGSYSVFTTNNRNDVIIGEPTTFGTLAAVGTLAGVCRRQRRKIKA
ncbi:MAG: hypothetical protein ABIP55_08580, partial [Tepidisphaeraceae bacterium]